MPTNLNALIRYKTINSCLYGGRRHWSLDELIDACTAALGESRGKKQAVSERTLRDDIRVMRSDILGFNAPIAQKDGLYYYSDKHYSIMSVGLSDPGLVERIIKLLSELGQKYPHPEIELILERLGSVAGADTREDGIYRKEKAHAPLKSYYNTIMEQEALFDRAMYNEVPVALLWGDILGIVQSLK